MTNSGSNSVTVLQGETSFVVLGEIAVGQRPTGVATLSAKSGLNHAYVANRDGNTISVIDTASDKVIATIPVGKGPVGVTAGIIRTR